MTEMWFCKRSDYDLMPSLWFLYKYACLFLHISLMHNVLYVVWKWPTV